MAQPPPLDPYWNLSEVSLLRRILTNLNDWIANGGGGGGGGGVNKIIAGSGISVSPGTGLGNVTVSATGGGAGVARAAATNNAGNTTITPTASIQKYVLTLTGAARTSIIILDTAGRSAGDKIFLNLILPATANIVIAVRNATSGGTLLLPVESFPTQTLTTDGNLLSAHWEFTYTGAAWEFDTSNLPA